MNKTKINGYEKLSPQKQLLVDKVIANMENGQDIWVQGWKSSGLPRSAITGKPYKGINNLFLSLVAMSEGYRDNRWVTYHQMQEKGWSFKLDSNGKSLAKGKGASLEFYELRDKQTKKPFNREVLEQLDEDEKNEYIEKNVYPVRKFYRVFNADLIDGIKAEEHPILDETDKSNRAEEFIKYWSENESKINYGSQNSYYVPKTDEIFLPLKQDFVSMQAFYSTALHEIGHSTGHISRLDRKLDNSFGSKDYAIEELRAEIASLFLEQDFNISLDDSMIRNKSAYVKAWLSEIKQDPNVLFKAVIDADKIAKYILEKEKCKDNVSSQIVSQSNVYFRPSTIVNKEEVNNNAVGGIQSLTKMSDREVVEKAQNVKSGDIFNKLYRGERVFSSVEKDESMLMLRLAMFCGKDKEKLLRVFNSSGQCKGNKNSNYYNDLAQRSIDSLSNVTKIKKIIVSKKDKMNESVNVKA